MDPHEYWPFSSGFQHIFETSGDSLALICCWHPAVHVFCNRCALQMSTELEQKLMQPSSQLHSGPEEEGADKRQHSRSLSQCWLQLLLLKQTRWFCTNKGDPLLYKSLNTSCMLVTMKLCKRWGSQIFQIVIGWDSG